MISLTKNFILLTPPKTAATSLVLSLSEHIEIYNVEDTEISFDYTEYPPEPRPGRENRLAKHYDARWYYDKIMSGKYKVFGVTRNPWDRMVSWWLWNNEAKNYDQSFESFIRDPYDTGWWWLYTNTIEFASLNNRTNTSFHDFNPIGPPASEYVDMYLRFESLQEDFDVMCEKVEIEKRELPHRNKSADKEHYTEYYNDETREIVANIFAKDIEYFGYEY